MSTLLSPTKKNSVWNNKFRYTAAEIKNRSDEELEALYQKRENDSNEQ